MVEEIQAAMRLHELEAEQLYGSPEAEQKPLAQMSGAELSALMQQQIKYGEMEAQAVFGSPNTRAVMTPLPPRDANPPSIMAVGLAMQSQGNYINHSGHYINNHVYQPPPTSLHPGRNLNFHHTPEFGGLYPQ